MPCNHPLPAWRTKAPLPSGKMGVTFTHQLADTSLKMEIPCGRCMGCRLERARQWAIRLSQEAKLYKQNWFVTLTYNEATLPRTVQGLPTLQPEHFTRFMKRLRRAIQRGKVGGGAPPAPLAPPPGALPRVRYYQCGEYGETTQRPHHHAILFNLALPDLKPIRATRARNAHTLYTSATLEALWSHGHISIGQVTFETAAYVAAYVTKKITGAAAAAHYQGRVPEYATMSRRPGIGTDYLLAYKDEIYTHDSVVVRGMEMKPPKAYDRQLERRDPETYYEIRDRRANLPRRQPHPREREARELTIKQQTRKRDAT